MNAIRYNSTFVVFGATGDLTYKKLLPALYRLEEKELLHKNFTILAVSRRDKTDEEYRKDAKTTIKKHTEDFSKNIFTRLSDKIYYHKNDFETEEGYTELKEILDKREGKKIFYLATLPRHFEDIIKRFKKYNYVDRKSEDQYRIIIEKPFGFDLESAKKLNKVLTSLFKEREIFRIDHYLGKEAVQNIFAFRFSNRIFEPVWNSEHIDHIQITALEEYGVKGRGEFYDRQGALRDMVQNHIMHLLSFVTMDAPSEFNPESIKDEKIKMLESIEIDNFEENSVFGQYEKDNGGKDYVEEDGVEKNSRTETYAALKLRLNNERWRNTPVYLRTGKRLRKKATEIVVHFKQPETEVFNQNPEQKPNVLCIRLYPDEGIFLRFNAKKPGEEFELEEVSMDFCQSCLFDYNTPQAYERLLLEIMKGDKTLFTRWDEVEDSWKIITPILDYWENEDRDPFYYRIGSWGPKKAEELIEKDGREWRIPGK